MEELNELCQCGVSSDNIDGALFHCFDPSSLYVTYRARLSGTPETDGQTLVSYLENWVSGGPSISVQSILMRIDSDCPVTFNDAECAETPVSQSSTSTDNTAAIIGGVVAVVVTVPVLIFALALVWRGCHGKLSIHKFEE